MCVAKWIDGDMWSGIGEAESYTTYCIVSNRVLSECDIRTNSDTNKYPNTFVSKNLHAWISEYGLGWQKLHERIPEYIRHILCCMVLVYSVVWYNPVLYGVVPYYPVLHCVVWCCNRCYTVFHCVTLYYTVLQCVTRCCMALLGSRSTQRPNPASATKWGQQHMWPGIKTCHDFHDLSKLYFPNCFFFFKPVRLKLYFSKLNEENSTCLGMMNCHDLFGEQILPKN